MPAPAAEEKVRTYRPTSAGLRGYANRRPTAAEVRARRRGDRTSQEPATVLKLAPGSGRYLLTVAADDDDDDEGRTSTPSMCRPMGLEVEVEAEVGPGGDGDGDQRDSRSASRSPLPLPIERTRPGPAPALALAPAPARAVLNVSVRTSRSPAEMLRQQSGWCLGSSVTSGRRFMGVPDVRTYIGT